MNRRDFIMTIMGWVGAHLTGCLGGTEKLSPRGPNIIFILADDLGYGDLGCYGQKLIKTPALDRMAGEGMRFTQHYSGSTICAPSRCCLMTGRHTGHATVRGNGDPGLTADDVTVLEVLKSAGYRTGVIGKWGLGDINTPGRPSAQGADHFFGYLDQVHAHNYYPEWLWRNGQKVYLDNEVMPAVEKHPQARGGYAVKRNDYSHDLFTKEAMEFIKANRRQPFFVYLAYTIPHANSESFLFGKHGMEVPGYEPYTGKDWPEAQKGLAAMITRMDRDIGGLLSLLKKLGIDENTIVFFSSDNGPHSAGLNDPHFFDSNGPLRGIKRDLYEGGIRVPLIVRWPGRIKPGTQSDHVSAFWDLLPTAAELAGVNSPWDIDGISYLPELTSGPQPKHEYLYWEFHEKGGHFAVRKDNWKYILLPDGKEELYDLSEDIGEQNDLSGTMPGIIAELSEIVKRMGS